MSQPSTAFAGETASAVTVMDVPLDEVMPDTHQVRRVFDDEALQQLADSIREHGVIQPIVVRPLDHADDAPYQIIAGERRWRAAGLAGLQNIPAVIRTDLIGKDIAVLQILENLQRQDLSLAETCAGVAKLVDALGNAKTAEQLGKSEAWVSKHASIEKLPPQVSAMVVEGKLDSADIAHEIAQLLKVADESSYYVRSTLEAAAEGTLTRAQVRSMLSSAKAQAEREAKWAKEREERATDEQVRAQDPEHQAKLRELQEEEAQRQRAMDKAAKRREKRKAHIEALEAAVQPRIKAWMEALNKTLGLDVIRDEDTGEIVTDPYEYDIESDLVIETSHMSPYDESPLPKTADEVDFRLQIRLTSQQLAAVMSLLLGGQESDKPEKQGDLDVAAFIAERIDRSNAKAKALATDVYNAYQNWCRDFGVKALSLNDNRFGDAIAAAGIEKIRSNGIRYVGVTIRS